MAPGDRLSATAIRDWSTISAAMRNSHSSSSAVHGWLVRLRPSGFQWQRGSECNVLRRLDFAMSFVRITRTLVANQVHLASPSSNAPNDKSHR